MANNEENVPQNTNEQNPNDQTIKVDNALYLHSSDHSSLVLVTDLFTEHNYTPWSRSMMITLEARDKEIKESFGKVNGQRVYELRRKVYVARQGNDSVTVYYNKFKRLWDEFRCIKPSLVRIGDDEEKIM
ncbi:hypothetical protein LIER_32096 [Lithospermum erythrorhizon]|uniref:Retrotransposon Copia-like N-terminal domain-containing protein n=1 Tax=Lithospermum erythrorhizon TaxID=34254 RepID=A0AAV3RUP2_LITER